MLHPPNCEFLYCLADVLGSPRFPCMRYRRVTDISGSVEPGREHAPRQSGLWSTEIQSHDDRVGLVLEKLERLVSALVSGLSGNIRDDHSYRPSGRFRVHEPFTDDGERPLATNSQPLVIVGRKMDLCVTDVLPVA